MINIFIDNKINKYIFHDFDKINEIRIKFTTFEERFKCGRNVSRANTVHSIAGISMKNKERAHRKKKCKVPCNLLKKKLN